MNASAFIWVAGACAVLGGFFSLASISLRSFRRVQLEAAFGARADRLKAFDRHLTDLRLTVAFCRSLANLLLAVAAVYLFEPWRAGWVGMLWAVLVAGALMGVLGVAIPNAWAAHAAERVLAATFPLLMAAYYALYPVVAVLRAFETPVRRLWGVEEFALRPEQEARQEILQAASEGRAEGAVREQEAVMIQSIVKFGDRRAVEIMTPRTEVYALPAETPWPEACRRVAAAGHSRVPVYQGDLDHVVGILYAKDLLSRVGEADVPLASLLHKPYLIPQTKPLSDLLREFRVRQVHAAIVLDEYGGTAGLVTIEDVLEEIVGEIADEHDRPTQAMLRWLEPGTAEVDGRMYVDDLNVAMGTRIPEDEDYDTVAGFLFSELGYVPTVGETLQARGAEFKVLEATERKISRLRVRALPGEEAST